MRLALVLLVALLPVASAAPHAMHEHDDTHDEHAGHDHAARHAAHSGHPAADRGMETLLLREAAPVEAADAAATPAAEGPEAATVALGAAATLGACALVAGYGAPLARRFAGAIALFTRVGRERALDQRVRQRIHDHVRAHPGASIEEAARAAGVVRTTAAYHLRVLERAGLVIGRAEGRTRRYTLPGAVAPPFALAHPVGRALAEAAKAAPGSDRATLAARLGVDPKLAHWHLARLQKAGVVRGERAGRTVRYFPGQG